MGNIAPTAAQQTNEYLYSIIRELENHEQYPAVHPLTPCMLHGKIFKTIPYYISRSSSESKKVALKILYKYTKALPNDTNQELDVSPYKQGLAILNTAITSTCPHHVIPWHVADEFQSDKAYFIRRQWLPHTLLDRIHSQPALSHTELRWFIYQLLRALSLLHVPGICHGDLKPENLLVSSWGWLYITDFAIWKPSSLPTSYDSLAFKPFEGHHPGCYIAPERFSIRTRSGVNLPASGSSTMSPSATSTTTPQNTNASTSEIQETSSANSFSLSIFENILSNLETNSPTVEALQKKIPQDTLETMLGGDDGKVRQPMDIFSLGCVVFAMYSGGRELFDIPTILRYREGLFDPSSQLKKIEDVEARALVSHMIQLDPSKRWSARQYLQELSASGFFPSSFALMYSTCLQFATLGANCSSDTIANILDQHSKLLIHASFGESETAQNLPTTSSASENIAVKTSISGNTTVPLSADGYVVDPEQTKLGLGPAVVSKSYIAMKTMKSDASLSHAQNVSLGLSTSPVSPSSPTPSLTPSPSSPSLIGSASNSTLGLLSNQALLSQQHDTDDFNQVAGQMNELSDALKSGAKYDVALVNALEEQQRSSEANVQRRNLLAQQAIEANDPTIYTSALKKTDLDPNDPYNDPVWVSYLTPKSPTNSQKNICDKPEALDSSTSSEVFDTSSSLREALPVAASLLKILQSPENIMDKEVSSQTDTTGSLDTTRNTNQTPESPNEQAGQTQNDVKTTPSSSSASMISTFSSMSSSAFPLLLDGDHLNMMSSEITTLPVPPATLPLINTMSIVALIASACCGNVNKVSSKVTLLALCRRIAPYLDSSTILSRIVPVLLAEINSYVSTASSSSSYGDLKAAVMLHLSKTDPLFSSGAISIASSNSNPSSTGSGSELALAVLRGVRQKDCFSQRQRSVILSTGGIAADVISTLSTSLARVSTASSLLSMVVPGFVLPALITLTEASSKMPEVVLVQAAKSLLPIFESAIALTEHRHEMNRRHILVEKKRILAYIKMYPEVSENPEYSNQGRQSLSLNLTETDDSLRDSFSRGMSIDSESPVTTSNTRGAAPKIPSLHSFLKNFEETAFRCGIASTSASRAPPTFADDVIDFEYDLHEMSTPGDYDRLDEELSCGDSNENIHGHGSIETSITPAAALARCERKLIQLSQKQVEDQNILETMAFRVMSNIITSSYSSAKCVLMSYTPRLMTQIKSERLQNDLVVYLSTLFNARDWRLLVALIQHLAPICVIIGRAKTHSMLYNLILQSLTDQRNEVVIASLHLFTQLSRVGLLAPSSVLEVACASAFLLVSPPASLRLAASELILTAADVCGPARSFLRLTPLLQPYIRVASADLLLLTPSLFASVLKPALSPQDWNKLRNIGKLCEEDATALLDSLISSATSNPTSNLHSPRVESIMDKLALLCPSANLVDKDVLHAVAIAFGLRSTVQLNTTTDTNSPDTPPTPSSLPSSKSQQSTSTTAPTGNELDTQFIISSISKTKFPSPFFGEAIEFLLKSQVSSQDTSLELLPFVLAHFRESVNVYSAKPNQNVHIPNSPNTGSINEYGIFETSNQIDRFRQNMSDSTNMHGPGEFFLSSSQEPNTSITSFSGNTNAITGVSTFSRTPGNGNASNTSGAFNASSVTLAGIILHWLRVLEGGSGAGQSTERMLLSFLSNLLSGAENRRFGMLLPPPSVLPFPSQLEPITAKALKAETDVLTRLEKCIPLSSHMVSTSSFYRNCHIFVADNPPTLLPNRAAAASSASVSTAIIPNMHAAEQYLPPEPTGLELDISTLLQKVEDGLKPVTLLEAHGFTSDGKPKPRPPAAPRNTSTSSGPGAVSGKALSAAFRAVANGGWACPTTGDPSEWRPAGALLSTLTGHTGRVSALCVAPDNTFVATGCEDGKIRIWDSNSLCTLGRPAPTASYSFDTLFENSTPLTSNTSFPKTSVSAICSLDYSQTLCAAGSDGSVRVTALEQGFSTAYDCVRFCIDTTTGVSSRSRYSSSNGSAFSASSSLAHATDSIVAIDHFSTLSQSLMMIGTHSGLIYGWDLRCATPAFTLQQNYDCGALSAMSVGPTSYCIQAGSQSGFVSIFDVRFQLPVSCWAVPSKSRISSLTTEIASSWFSHQAALKSGGALPTTGDPLLIVATEGSPDIGAYDISSGVCRSILRSAPTLPASNSASSAITVGAAAAFGKISPFPVPSGSLVKQPLRTINTSLSVERLVRSATISSSVPLYTSGYLHCPSSYVITAGSDSTIRFWNLNNSEASYRITGPASHEDISYKSSVQELNYKVDSAQNVSSASVWVCEEQVVGMDPTRVSHRYASHTEPISHLRAIQYPQKMLITAAGKDVKVWM